MPCDCGMGPGESGCSRASRFTCGNPVRKSLEDGWCACTVATRIVPRRVHDQRVFDRSNIPARDSIGAGRRSRSWRVHVGPPGSGLVAVLPCCMAGPVRLRTSIGVRTDWWYEPAYPGFIWSAGSLDGIRTRPICRRSRL